MVEPRGVEPRTFSLRMVTKSADYQQDTTNQAELFGKCLETLHERAYSKAQAVKDLQRITYGARTQEIQQVVVRDLHGQWSANRPQPRGPDNRQTPAQTDDARRR